MPVLKFDFIFLIYKLVLNLKVIVIVLISRSRELDFYAHDPQCYEQVSTMQPEFLFEPTMIY